MELTDVQLFIIGAAASIVVWVVKLLRSKGGDISTPWLTALVYVASAVLAWVFAPVALPPLPPFVDLATFIPALLVWIGDLLVPLSAFVGFATLVYNVFLKQVLDNLGARLRKAFASG